MCPLTPFSASAAVIGASNAIPVIADVDETLTLLDRIRARLKEL